MENTKHCPYIQQQLNKVSFEENQVAHVIALS